MSSKRRWPERSTLSWHRSNTGILRATDCLGKSVADVNVGALLGDGDRDLPYVPVATRGFFVRCDAAQLGQQAAD
jgi:hypothetical protein